MIIQYNWHELQTITKVPENQILLMYALSVGFAQKMSNHPIMLRDKLNLDVVPMDLFKRRFLLRTDIGIFSNYQCNEPQNYITNVSFLHSKVSPITKLEYLYILSQRSLKNLNTWIPEDYVEPQYRKNVYVYTRNGKIYFPLEKQIKLKSQVRPKPVKKQLEKQNDGTRLDQPKETTSTRKWS